MTHLDCANPRIKQDALGRESFHLGGSHGRTCLDERDAILFAVRLEWSRHALNKALPGQPVLRGGDLFSRHFLSKPPESVDNLSGH